MSTEVSGDCVCIRGGGQTPRSCPNPGSWANLQARAAPEGALLLADPGRPVSSGLLPIHSAHSPRSQRPALGEVARTRSWPASETSWLAFSDEAELVSREVAGLDLGGGNALGPQTPSPSDTVRPKGGTEEGLLAVFRFPSRRPCERQAWAALTLGLSTHRASPPSPPAGQGLGSWPAWPALPARPSWAIAQSCATPEAQPNSRRESTASLSLREHVDFLKASSFLFYLLSHPHPGRLSRSVPKGRG